MKRAVRVLAIACTLTVLAFSTAADNSPAPFEYAKALWEPTWSPFQLPLNSNGWHSRSSGFVVANLYDDGLPEIVVNSESLYVYDFESLEDRPYARHVDLTRSTSSEGIPHKLLCSGDLDGNGRDDLIAIGQGEVWSLLSGSVACSFTIPHDAPAAGPGNPFRAWLGRRSTDAPLDLLIADNAVNRMFLLRGRGDGTFSDMEEIQGTSGRPFAALWTDAALWVLTIEGLWHVDDDSLECSRILNHGGRALARIAAPPVEGTTLAIGSLDGLHVVTISDGEALSLSSFLAGKEISSISSADLDGDGGCDLLCTATGWSGYWTFFATGSPGQYVPVWQGMASVPSGQISLPGETATCDLNGDGAPEVLLFSHPSTLSVQSITPVGVSRQELPGVLLLGSADLNGDSYADILVDGPSGEILSLLGSASGVLVQEHVTARPKELSDWAPLRATVGEFAGNGARGLLVLGQAGTTGSTAVALWQEGEEDWIERGVVHLPHTVLPSVHTAEVEGSAPEEIILTGGEALYVLSCADRLQASSWQAYDLPGEAQWLTVARTANDKDRVIVGCYANQSLEICELVDRQVTRLDVAPEGIVSDGWATDIDGDNRDELVLLEMIRSGQEPGEGLGTTVSIHQLFGEPDGSRSEPIEGWPPHSLPFPLLGTTLSRRADGGYDLALLTLPIKGSRPRLGISTTNGMPETHWIDNVSGLCLLSADVNGDGWDDLVWKDSSLAPSIGLVLGGIR